jgi:hypothetical protein
MMYQPSQVGAGFMRASEIAITRSAMSICTPACSADVKVIGCAPQAVTARYEQTAFHSAIQSMSASCGKLRDPAWRKRKRRPNLSADQKLTYVLKWLQRPTTTVAISESVLEPCNHNAVFQSGSQSSHSRTWEII